MRFVLETYVLMTTSCGSTPYFLFNSTLIMDASKPFRAEMLSANRQLMGMLGLSVPTNSTFSAHSSISSGSVRAMSGLFKIPSRSIFCVSFGIEYFSTSFVCRFAPFVAILFSASWVCYRICGTAGSSG